jgi:hypothetical protein
VRRLTIALLCVAATGVATALAGLPSSVAARAHAGVIHMRPVSTDVQPVAASVPPPWRSGATLLRQPPWMRVALAGMARAAAMAGRLRPRAVTATRSAPRALAVPGTACEVAAQCSIHACAQFVAPVSATAVLAVPQTAVAVQSAPRCHREAGQSVAEPVGNAVVSATPVSPARGATVVSSP